MSHFVRGVLTALVVGTILTCINQFESLSRPSSLNLTKLALTYCTPFCVYLFGAMTSAGGWRDFMAGRAAGTASLRDDCVAQTAHLHELGITVHENACKVNKASTERLGVAETVITDSTRMIEFSENIDSLSNKTLNRISSLAEQADRVMDTLDQLILRISGALDWTSGMSGRIGDFEEQFQSILEKTSAISAFTEQARMLAINASVEAARAGEMGRGFAVVATEVKALANKSEQQTSDIAETLDRLTVSLHAIREDATEFSRTLNTTLTTVSEGQSGSLQLRTQMGAALAEVTQNIDDISAATQQLRQRTQQTREGMVVLVEGTKAAVQGSSSNIQIGTNITLHSDQIRQLLQSSAR